MIHPQGARHPGRRHRRMIFSNQLESLAMEHLVHVRQAVLDFGVALSPSADARWTRQLESMI
jgi:hypothetical protein